MHRDAKRYNSLIREDRDKRHTLVKSACYVRVVAAVINRHRYIQYVVSDHMRTS